MMSAELPATGSPSHDERGRDDHGDSESVAEYSDHAAATTGGSTPERAEAARRVMLAVRETRAVNGLRYAVAVVLLVATVFVSGGLYLETHRDQKDDFKNQFAGYALRIVGNADLQLERKLAALDAMATPYTSQALSSADGGGFPNVTLPHAEIRGANARILADTLFCQYLVLVTDETRAGWEAYAAENEKSMDEEYYREVDQRARQDSRFNLTSPTTQPVVRLDGYRPKIYDLSTVRPDGSGPYMVYWQSSPVMPTKFLLNFDMLSHPNIRNVLLKMMETEQAALDTASNLLLKVDGEKAISANEIFDFFVANGQFRHQIKEYEGSPITNIAYPVFDSFGEDRKLAGAITTAVRFSPLVVCFRFALLLLCHLEWIDSPPFISLCSCFGENILSMYYPTMRKLSLPSSRIHATKRLASASTAKASFTWALLMPTIQSTTIWPFDKPWRVV